jgi:hypothetical protein
MYFEIISEITDIERIAAGSSIREIERLRKQFGAGRWRKLKGIATVRLAGGRTGRSNFLGINLMASVKGSSKSNAI